MLNRLPHYPGTGATEADCTGNGTYTHPVGLFWPWVRVGLADSWPGVCEVRI